MDANVFKLFLYPEDDCCSSSSPSSLILLLPSFALVVDHGRERVFFPCPVVGPSFGTTVNNPVVVILVRRGGRIGGISLVSAAAAASAVEDAVTAGSADRHHLCDGLEVVGELPLRASRVEVLAPKVVTAAVVAVVVLAVVVLVVGEGGAGEPTAGSQGVDVVVASVFLADHLKNEIALF